MIKRKGFTLVEIMIVVAIIALLAAIAIPNLLRARLQANESVAQAALKTIATAEISWRAANATYGTLGNLSGATPPYIDGVLGTGTKNGYTFAIVGNDANVFTSTAVPQNANQSGVRSFCVTEDGVVRVQAAGGAIADHAACVALPSSSA